MWQFIFLLFYGCSFVCQAKHIWAYFSLSQKVAIFIIYFSFATRTTVILLLLFLCTLYEKVPFRRSNTLKRGKKKCCFALWLVQKTLNMTFFNWDVDPAKKKGCLVNISRAPNKNCLLNLRYLGLIYYAYTFFSSAIYRCYRWQRYERSRAMNIWFEEVSFECNLTPLVYGEMKLKSKRDRLRLLTFEGETLIFLVSKY